MDENIAKRLLWGSILKDFDEEEGEKRKKFGLLYDLAVGTKDNKEKEEKLNFLFNLVKNIDEFEEKEKNVVKIMITEELYGIRIL